MSGKRRAIGFMSGTSMGGVDVTPIESIGEQVIHSGEGMLRPYAVEERFLIEGAVTATRDLTHRSARPAPLAEQGGVSQPVLDRRLSSDYLKKSS